MGGPLTLTLSLEGEGITWLARRGVPWGECSSGGAPHLLPNPLPPEGEGLPDLASGGQADYSVGEEQVGAQA